MNRQIPKISASWLKWFKRYARWYVGRHFHAVRVSRAGGVPRLHDSAVFVANHPSWWDPLVWLLLTDVYPDRQHFAPMEDAALQKYGFFTKLGIFGASPERALSFVRTGRALLAQPGTALWVTAQGRFADVRERPVTLRRGVDLLGCETVIPVAIEYTFWHERFPEILVRFGRPGESLEQTLDALAAEAMQQRADLFDTLIAGRVGIGGVYDAWRRWRHPDFRPEHEALVRS